MTSLSPTAAQPGRQTSPGGFVRWIEGAAYPLVNYLECRAAVKACFERCNAEALTSFCGERAALYARLKLAGLNEAPCQFAVFADRTTEQGHGLGRLTMPATIEYSAVMSVHTEFSRSSTLTPRLLEPVPGNV